jgi:hypothetical protein
MRDSRVFDRSCAEAVDGPRFSSVTTELKDMGYTRSP